jgi:uncharacterized membrane protein YqjE
MSSADQSISDLLHDIAVNLQDIVRSEIGLAKTELREEFTKAKAASVMTGLGALSGIFFILFLLLTAFLALTRVMPDWAAALAVAAGLAIIAAILLSAGSKRFKTVKAMPKTVNSLEGNIPWAAQQSK